MAKISAPLEPSDSFPIFLDLLELNKKKMRLYAPVKLGKDDEEEQDILIAAGDHTYQV